MNRSAAKPVRAFFALEIPSPVGAAIAAWRARWVGAAGRPVAAANLHITLNFLGAVDPPRLEALCAAVTAPEHREFDLTLDTAGYFRGSRVVWIGASVTPPALLDWVEALRTVSRNAGLRADDRPFRPHLTVLRSCRAPPPAPAARPDFPIRFHGFTLLESISSPGGVRYRSVRRWPPLRTGRCAR